MSNLVYVTSHLLKLKTKNLQLQSLHSSFHGICFLPIFREVLMVGDFNAWTSSHQGQDLHLHVYDINLLEVPIPQWLGEAKDIGHCNAFGGILIENLSFSAIVILNEANKLCKNFTCFSSLGGAYCSRLPNMWFQLPSQFYIWFSKGSKQPDSNQCSLFFKICHSVEPKLPTPSSRHQVLHPISRRQINTF